MRELMIALMVWVSGLVGYAVPEPPHVVWESEWTMRCMAWDAEYGACPPSAEQSVTPPDVGAWYDPQERAVHLRDGWSAGDPRDVATLVHELVHHMQFAAGRDREVECVGQLEPEAYRVGARWLASQGRESLDPVNELFVLFASLCRGDWH